MSSFSGAALLVYASVLALAYLGQRRLIYPAPRRGSAPEQLPGIVRIPSATGAVYALHRPAAPGAPTVVHFHGNGEELADLGPLVERLVQAGLGVYAVEYPGYGLARDGVPSEPALYDAARAALEYLHRELGVPRDEAVLLGQSLGSAVAVDMALRGYGGRLILLSPFTSMPDMAAHVLPLWPSRYLVRDRYDSLAKAAELTLPALVIHGDRDEVVPFEMGRRLAQRLGNSRFVAIAGGRHNDLFAAPAGRVIAEIAEFAGVRR